MFIYSPVYNHSQQYIQYPTTAPNFLLIIKQYISTTSCIFTVSSIFNNQPQPPISTWILSSILVPPALYSQSAVFSITNLSPNFHLIIKQYISITSCIFTVSSIFNNQPQPLISTWLLSSILVPPTVYSQSAVFSITNLSPQFKQYISTTSCIFTANSIFNNKPQPPIST